MRSPIYFLSKENSDDAFQKVLADLADKESATETIKKKSKLFLMIQVFLLGLHLIKS